MLFLYGVKQPEFRLGVSMFVRDSGTLAWLISVNVLVLLLDWQYLSFWFSCFLRDSCIDRHRTVGHRLYSRPPQRHVARGVTSVVRATMTRYN